MGPAVSLWSYGPLLRTGCFGAHLVILLFPMAGHILDLLRTFPERSFELIVGFYMWAPLRVLLLAGFSLRVAMMVFVQSDETPCNVEL